MLPNLANVRRPSKSAIVNSSIALIQSQRRNRIIAAREVRLIKAENDALRQELNEWRQRSNLSRVEEPPRSTDLLALLNLNEEDEIADSRAEFDGNYNLDDAEDYAEDGDEEQQSPDSYAPYTAPGPVSVPIPVTHNQQHQAQLQQQAQAILAHQKAAMARASQGHAQLVANRLAQQQSQQHIMYGADSLFPSDAFALHTPVDNAHLYGGGWPQAQQKLPVTPQLITPPSSAHGLSTNKPSPYANAANQAFLTGYSQNSGLGLGMFHSGPGSALEDDNLSVGSGSSHHDGSSSHYSAGAGSPELLMGTSPIDHGFAYAPPAQNYGQARRPSLNIPAHAYLHPTGTSPNQSQTQFLMI